LALSLSSTNSSTLITPGFPTSLLITPSRSSIHSILSGRRVPATIVTSFLDTFLLLEYDGVRFEEEEREEEEKEEEEKEEEEEGTDDADNDDIVSVSAALKHSPLYLSIYPIIASDICFCNEKIYIFIT
jgi:hypothetical protein